ncbi:hypothetical protein KIN20_009582 [Parelaphostrongylus tenuis]|uniref:Uncharacterized protein n=1 Tax=Parelaphostrongylus tenuis TaxID=148309 RepID=A0AAD5QJQ2_PARTN|nr:hypothetical protein KIN20_009582 [Parelaphostrongylus tenuis]
MDDLWTANHENLSQLAIYQFELAKKPKSSSNSRNQRDILEDLCGGCLQGTESAAGSIGINTGDESCKNNRMF